MNKRTDLVLGTATLQADPMSITVADFRAQLDAASAAGFAGISVFEFYRGPLEAEGFSVDDMIGAVADHGLEVAMIEALLPFSGLEADVLEAARHTFEFANRFGASIVPTVSLIPDEFETVEAAIERYAALCDVASDHGIKVPIEYLPWSAIPDLATAWQIVDAGDRSSGGIMLDTWHWVRQPGGPNTDLLSQIPPSFLLVVQLCDARPEPSEDLYGEAMTARLLPGEGVVDFDEFLTALYATGADPVMATEVFNSDLSATGHTPMAKKIAAASRQVLEPFV